MYIVTPGELFLKGKNRHLFEKRLLNNIKDKLNQPKIIKFSNKYLILKENCKDLNKVFGIATYSKVIETEFNNINQTALKLITTQKSFRITANRTHKNYKRTPEIEKEVGEYIVKNKNIKVNLTNPELTIYIDIIKDKAYLTTRKIKGLGGLPLGIEGKVYLKVNNEINSTVAGFLMMKRGCFLTLSKELPLLKKFDKNIKIEKEHGIIVTDETLDNLQENKFLKPLTGYKEKEIKEIYNQIIQL